MSDSHDRRTHDFTVSIRDLMDYWTHFEWRGWGFYRRHNRKVTVATWYDEMRPVRAIIAALSIAIGLFFIWPGDIFVLNPGYFYLRQWINEDVFGSIFLLHGAGIIWRTYAPAKHIGWARFFGVVGVTLYTFYPLALGFGLGHDRGRLFVLTGASLSLFIMAFACAWCARRIGVGEDKSGA